MTSNRALDGKSDCPIRPRTSEGAETILHYYCIPARGGGFSTLTMSVCFAEDDVRAVPTDAVISVNKCDE